MTEREPKGRKQTELRPISIQTDVSRYAEGSVLIKSGNTHVLCTASVEETVPSWLTGKGRGWVTAEYSMLPRSTHTRTKRERDKASGRTQEIQRLIGRALRSVVNLEKLGERSILIDCDVLQADGGTRTASITGGCVALVMALKKLERDGKVSLREVWLDSVSAISVGISRSNELLVDLDYVEDSSSCVDMNFVITGKGLFVEIQGTAEGTPFSKDQMDAMTTAAESAARQIHSIQLAAIASLKP
ncbi:MAG: ribonuclease PH [Bdellovibrionales bacterium RIFOXYC1_FULL_54_43]|nr:MAG: ribonuclease PH [Bdellovibrionales bacterium RIFOXYC1_FULL_54_43]OFZ84816.1 MAG: ribonuclease PH [Bdellovibrionales bacterium RIFOXYD1_FULL_55_31]